MVQTLSQIKALLAERGLRPRHRLGQNFLADPNKLKLILDAASVGPGQTVLEVGPGTGVLTEALIESGGRVIAVELDDQLADLLRDRLGDDHEKWTLIHGDILAGKHALNPDVDAALGGRDTPFTLIANLPYNIASPLLAILAADYPRMDRAIVMVQREVADRILAAPGGKQFGPLTVMIQNAMTGRLITTLSPGCFWPPPKISSAVIELTRREQPLTDDTARLATFVQTLFQKRRKQLGAILGRDFPFPDDVDPNARPEQLTVEQIVRMSTM